MVKAIIIQGLIITIFVIAYLIFTIRYFRILKKSIVFSRWAKMVHLIMIWLDGGKVLDELVLTT